MAAPTSVVDTVVSLCKRRGFVYPASEIYGGLNGFWDYGPLGVELQRNVNATMVSMRQALSDVRVTSDTIGSKKFLHRPLIKFQNET